MRSFAAASHAAHPVQRDVEDFHRAIGVGPVERPAIRRAKLRADLILEEARETAEALTGRACAITIGPEGSGSGNPSLIKTIDGCCDLLCVTYGTVDECGVDLAPFWDEVHRTNMAKIPPCEPCSATGRHWLDAARVCHACGGSGKGQPIRRADGKVLKPEGWVAPDIRGVFTRLYVEALREELA